ncbi:MAG: hypothetical protein H7287_11505 [Thermoleophilia bacterium]|nr:hypothetical protein [Thermoleophilia bacterium]
MSITSAPSNALPTTARQPAAATNAGAATGGAGTAPDTTAAQAQLTQPDPTYPALTALHVAVLQAIGTPPAAISEIAARKPDAAWLDSYLQNEIMQNPEGWDQFVGNPAGTARAGLTKLFPSVQLPAPGAGVGAMPSDSGSIPGITTPLLDPGATPVATKASEGEGIVKALVIGAVVVGGGLLAWKFFHGRGASAGRDVGAAVNDIVTGSGGVQGLAGKAKNAFGLMGGGRANQAVLSGVEGAAQLGAAGNLGRNAQALLVDAVKAGDPRAIRNAMTLGLLGGGATLGAGATTAFEATAHAVMSGLGPADNTIMSLGYASAATGIGMERLMQFHLADRAIDVQKLIAMAGTGAQAADGTATALLGAIQRIVT